MRALLLAVLATCRGAPATRRVAAARGRVRAVLVPPPAAAPAGQLSLDSLRAAARRGDNLDDVLESTQPFPLDGFQREALLAMLGGENVLLSAPTGSGKTAVGELAVLAAIAAGRRAVYTTPLKALSNQKFFDFCERFGSENVGLLTGDVCVQRDAPILLMTTEVFRNMLFDEPEAQRALGARARTRAANGLIDEVGVCVLDEFHYMGDRARGVTWEEVVIHAPRELQLLGLSATVPNGEQLRRWIEATHGRRTRLVRSDERPVPLRFHFVDGVSGVRPLFADAEAMPPAVAGASASASTGGATAEKGEGKAARSRGGFGAAGGSRARGGKGAKAARALRINAELLALTPAGTRAGGADAARRTAANDGGGMRALARRASRGGAPSKRATTSGGGRARSVGGDARTVRGWDGFPLAAQPRPRAPTPPSMPYLLRCLQRKGMLPAIVFIFSRAACDQAAAAAAADARSMLTAAEARELRIRVDAFERAQRAAAASGAGAAAVDAQALARLRAGVASHHAGQLPAFKKLVERLFADNLLKAVFATETLAAGVNMPCRTAVITALSKRGNSGIEPLGASSLLQMAGRAGRRGKDAVGHVVLAQSRWEGAEDAFRMVQRPADPIVSHFLLSYSSVLRTVVASGGLEGARRVLERSYGAFVRREAEAEAAERLAASGAADAPARGAADAAPERGAAARAEGLAVEAALVRAQLRAILGAAPAVAGDGGEAAPAHEANTAAREAEALAYAALAERLAAERNVLEWLCAQGEREQAERHADLLPFCSPGTRLRVRVAPPSAGPRPDANGGSGAEEAEAEAYQLAVVLRQNGPAALDAPRDAGGAAPSARADAEGAQVLVLAMAEGEGGARAPLDVAVLTAAHIAHIEMDDIQLESDAVAALAAAGPLSQPQAPRAGGAGGAGALGRAPIARVHLPPPICGATGWTRADDGAWRCPVAALGAEAEAALRALAVATRPLGNDGVDAASSDGPQVAQQRARIERLRAELERSPMHASPDAAEIARLGAQLAPLDKAEAKQRRRAARQAERRGAAASARAGGGASADASDLPYGDDSTWESLCGAYDVLVQYGAFAPAAPAPAPAAAAAVAAAAFFAADPPTDGATGAQTRVVGAVAEARMSALELSGFGRLVASLGGDNEVFLAAVLMSSNIFDGCAPHEVAAALSCLAAGELRQEQLCLLRPSERVLHAAEQLEPIALALLDAQASAGVEYPVNWSVQYAGLVQAWAAGLSWDEVMRATSLDAGDVLRLLSRTLELLRQTLNAPFVEPHVRESVREAMHNFDRAPIANDFLAQARVADAALGGGGDGADGADAPGAEEDEDEDEGRDDEGEGRVGWLGGDDVDDDDEVKAVLTS